MLEALSENPELGRYAKETLSKKDIVDDPLALQIKNFFDLLGVSLKEIHNGLGLQNRIIRNAGMRVGCLYQRIFGDGTDKDDKEQKRKVFLEGIIAGDTKLGVQDHIKLIQNARLFIPHALLLGQLDSSDRLSVESLLSFALLCTETDQEVRKKAKRTIKKDIIAAKLYEEYGSFFNRDVVNSTPLLPIHQKPVYEGVNKAVSL